MKPIEQFIGINNVSAPFRHRPGELTEALNIDVDATRALVSRRGRARIRAGQAHSPYRAPFGLLCVLDMDLGLLSDDGVTFTPLYFALGCDDRVWYATLPNGLVAFSNGYITGLTDGASVRAWGVPTPLTPAGNAVEGPTPYWLTYVRQSDGLEGGPIYCAPTVVGAPLEGLPVRAGYDIAVYYAVDGMTGFYAGQTATDAFTFGGEPKDLINPCRTMDLAPMPAGRCLAVWQSRALVAQGRVLWATTPFMHGFEMRNVARDFVQMPDDITFVHGVDAGLWVGTTAELVLLRGEAFGDLKVVSRRAGGVVLGSGTEVDFTLMAPDARPGGALRGAMCISGGEIVGCGSGGELQVYAAGQYKTTMTEAFATTRVRDGVMQYVVSPAP
jgi:hypothetical protein